jgi:G-protein signaling modulator 2
MCLELALEGERLCKGGDCSAGIAFFQAAIQAGTEDLRTLSAIYSQLGNAYFYLGDYIKAMQYHKLDLTLARSMNDKLGEAKSSGNLGNTLKVLGRFDEAIICCERHLTIARSLGDRLSEGRALYNLGNVYHAKGKQMGQKDPGDYPEDVKEALQKAVEYYQQNLELMRDLGDRGAQGRACGNLGNTFYLLGNFPGAIEHHQERLKIAKEFGDKHAERRANSNLGNSHIFLGQFELAADHYKCTLSLAMEIGERAVEAQACYSLGNTYTLLRDFPTAIDYHQRHLAIAQELGDRVGEARACWSLGNAHTAIGNHEKALYYAQLHYLLAKELGDPVGESTARMNVEDLRKILGMTEFSSDTESLPDISQLVRTSTTSNNSLPRHYRLRRQSMEQLDLIKLTPDGKKLSPTSEETATIVEQQENENAGQFQRKPNDEDFFEFLTKSQSHRMDDQRCSLKPDETGGARRPLAQQNILQPRENKHQLLEMIENFQSERMNEQRALLPGLRRSSANSAVADAAAEPDDAFFEALMRSQNNRLEEQRSVLPRTNVTMDAENDTVRPPMARKAGATVPDEDFLSLIMKVQGGRMEDQRATVPLVRPEPATGER